MKRLTITVSDPSYEILCNLAPPRKRSKLIEKLIREKNLSNELETDYAAMAKDKENEKEALEWCELGIYDAKNEKR